MSNDYQISAIALIAALLLAFAYLHLRFRNVRTALWILALVCSEIQAMLVLLVSRAAPGATISLARLANFPVINWMNVAAESALMLSSVLFLASLTSPSFRIGRVRILYAIPYLVPLLLYSLLYYGVSQHPTGKLVWVYWGLAAWATVVALLWSRQKGVVPNALALGMILFGALACVPFFATGDVYWPMRIVESGNMLMTGILVAYTYRRWSPGVLLAMLGFAMWALPPFFLLPPAHIHSGFPQFFLNSAATDRAVVLGKVFVALSLILVVLEDELRKNRAAQRRERRVRLELEAYARQAMTARSLEEFDRDSGQLCSLIVEQSHFSGAAIIVRSVTGAYTLVGSAGIDGATAGALDAVAQRLPANSFLEAGTPLVPDSVSLDLDLTPWLTPGDDLERLRLTRMGVVPMLAPDNLVEGALLLISPRVPLETLRADDLLPLEIFAGRLQAARAQALMLGKLIESERFAGVGQLATNVAQQLNNPLTVILGYSALLEESVAMGPERRGAEAIVVEARRMKSILERLSRFSRLTTQQFSSFPITDLITDIEQFHRTEFLRHSIEFHLTIQPDLPNIFGNTHQIRQALLHATQFAIDGVVRLSPGAEKAIRIDASSEDNIVRIIIAHTGNGFPYPERAFDSLSSGFSGTEATGIGLSLCAAIVREHRGHISAQNNQPAGAAVILELPIS